MRYRSIIFALALTCCLYTTGFSQSPGYRVETFGTRNGLLSSKIFSLTQSSDRILWIGSELGLSRYDGYSFTNYQYTKDNEPIGRILCITEDSLHGIWIGGDKGLFYLYNDSIHRVSIRDRASIAVEALLTDASGNVWAGELNALYTITPAAISQLKKNSSYTLQLKPPADFNKRVFDLACDSQQNIYVASFDGIFKLPASSKTYTTIWTNPNPDNHVHSVTVTSPDSIFWNRIHGHPTEMIRGKVNEYYTTDFLGRFVFSNRHKFYALTTSGVSWLAGNQLQSLVSYASLANNAMAAIIDEEENIWIGTWEGLFKFRKTAFRQYTLQQTIHTEAFSLLERKNGELLVGGNKGKLFSKKNNQFVPVNSYPAPFTNAEIMCMTETDDGALWLGSGYEGISQIKNGKLTNWENTGALKDNNCEALYTSDGKIFACTEQGVTLIDPISNEPMSKHYPFQKPYTRYPELFGCFRIAKSGYWFYGSQGLYALRNDKLVDDSIGNMPVKDLYINKIVSDKKGNIWVATLGKGLLRCRLEGNRLVMSDQYDSKKGLPSDNALAVLVDKNDNVWWGDYMSLSMLAGQGERERLITFNEKDGLLSSYYQSLKLEQQRDGTIWLLTSMGLVSFHPDSIGTNKLAPPFFLEQIVINRDKTIRPASNSLRLSHFENSLTFYYTAVCLSDPSKIQYAYRLKELDSNWIYTSSRSISYNLLRPGQYTFELKACNNNNVWSSPLQFSFTIRPPFWQTWWFMLLLVSLIAVLIFALFRRRIAVFKARSAIKQQMAELEAKAIRAQMNPHFIFNSLNAIQESIVLHDFDTSYQYLSKFSKLLRLVLNNSEKNFIRLSDEIEMNRLYLELESLRFKHSFSYSIQVDDSIDAEMISFPSLMLQPFVENAIWHGLMQKDGEKRLSILFKRSGDDLDCIIEDNGIGREKAGDIKRQKLGAHYFESKGTGLARQRMELLKASGAPSATLNFIDLVNEHGAAAGTKVIISIPLQVLK